MEEVKGKGLNALSIIIIATTIFGVDLISITLFGIKFEDLNPVTLWVTLVVVWVFFLFRYLQRLPGLFKSLRNDFLDDNFWNVVWHIEKALKYVDDEIRKGKARKESADKQVLYVVKDSLMGKIVTSFQRESGEFDYLYVQPKVLRFLQSLETRGEAISLVPSISRFSSLELQCRFFDGDVKFVLRMPLPGSQRDAYTLYQLFRPNFLNYFLPIFLAAGAMVCLIFQLF